MSGLYQESFDIAFHGVESRNPLDAHAAPTWHTISLLIRGRNYARAIHTEHSPGAGDQALIWC